MALPKPNNPYPSLCKQKKCTYTLATVFRKKIKIKIWSEMKCELPAINDLWTKSDQPLFRFQRKSDHLPFSLIFVIKGQFLRKGEIPLCSENGKIVQKSDIFAKCVLRKLHLFCEFIILLCWTIFKELQTELAQLVSRKIRSWQKHGLHTHF